MPTLPSRSLNRSGGALVASLGFLAFSLIGFSAQQKTAAVAKPTKDQITFFESKIRPVLVDKCYACHGPTAKMGGLRVNSVAALLKGGQSGPAIIPGEPNQSLLVVALRQTTLLKMPQGGKLKPNEVADIEAWVQMGAPWPETPGAKEVEPEKWWSLQPVKKVALPKVKNTAWIRNGIDAFVLAKLEAKKLAPASPADKHTLMRRVTYDLTGLAPTAGEMQAFLTDKSPTAYDKVVDRLLASPRYGERWARRWLDVARYADTKGYVFNEDRNYPNAYTYRDWVVAAMNKDLPYDQFVIQQLAADRVPDVQNGEDKTPLAALGFLSVGRRFLNSQPDIIDDRIDVTMRGFQAFTVECARCHDHKFDPIPTQDYYSLYSVFASSSETMAAISEKSIREPWEKYSQRVTSLDATSKEIISSQVKRLRKLNTTPDTQNGVSAEVKKALQSFREEELPDAATLAKLMPVFEPAERDHLNGVRTELESLKKSPPPTPELAMAMVDSNPHDGVVFRRGNPANGGEVAPRRFLSALTKPGVEREHWTSGSGRLELAKSIASKDNPLTARVFVNRIWQDHFGAGIVRTPSDFGHQGEKPTHPELLDYLASTFMENGWSIKKLHRFIVTSNTYRQSSNPTAQTLAADPDNRLVSRMNRHRLDMEQMRDSLMNAAGRLDIKQVGGKSVDLWAKPFTGRRAVYGFVERQNLPGTFRTFDFASPDSTSARRFTTTVPQQALFFLNSALAVEDAQDLVKRPEIAKASDDGQRVRRLYLLLFQRLPDADELASGVAYLHHGEPSVMAPDAVWRYGYGEIDREQSHLSFFTPISELSAQGYQPTKTFPDPVLGYILLSAQGGHPGHDRKHCVVRRWVAPKSMTIRILGSISHPQAQGDGIGARIISSRIGLVGRWNVHNTTTKAEIPSVAVEKGDTIDFVVDPLDSDGYDGFGWSPTVQAVDGSRTWEAAADFGPPPGPPISRLALYAQALLMTNEFLFVD